MSHITPDAPLRQARDAAPMSLASSTDWKKLSTWDLPSAAMARRALLATLDRLPEANLDDPSASAVHSLVWDMVDEAECYILDQTPTTNRDAVAILDLLLEGEASRSDRRDQDALQRVRDLLSADLA